MMYVQEIIQNSSYILIRGLYSSLNVCMRSFHDVTDTRHKFIAYYPCMPTPLAYAKVFLPCLNLQAT